MLLTPVKTGAVPIHCLTIFLCRVADMPGLCLLDPVRLVCLVSNKVYLLQSLQLLPNPLLVTAMFL